MQDVHPVRAEVVSILLPNEGHHLRFFWLCLSVGRTVDEEGGEGRRTGTKKAERVASKDESVFHRRVLASLVSEFPSDDDQHSGTGGDSVNEQVESLRCSVAFGSAQSRHVTFETA